MTSLARKYCMRIADTMANASEWFQFNAPEIIDFIPPIRSDPMNIIYFTQFLLNVFSPIDIVTATATAVMAEKGTRSSHSTAYNIIKLQSIGICCGILWPDHGRMRGATNNLSQFIYLFIKHIEASQNAGEAHFMRATFMGRKCELLLQRAIMFMCSALELHIVNIIHPQSTISRRWNTYSQFTASWTQVQNEPY